MPVIGHGYVPLLAARPYPQRVRECEAVVWPEGDETVPGKRVAYLAEDGDAAEAALRAEHGQDVVFTLWNDEDADRPRRD